MQPNRSGRRSSTTNAQQRPYHHHERDGEQGAEKGSTTPCQRSEHPKTKPASTDRRPLQVVLDSTLRFQNGRLYSRPGLLLSARYRAVCSVESMGSPPSRTADGARRSTRAGASQAAKSGDRALSLRLRNAQADGSSARRPMLVLSGRKWLIQGRAASGSRRRCATRAAPILGIVPIASRTVGGVEGQDASTGERPPSRPCRAGRRRPRRSSTRTSGAPGNRPILAG